MNNEITLKHSYIPYVHLPCDTSTKFILSRHDICNIDDLLGDLCNSLAQEHKTLETTVYFVDTDRDTDIYSISYLSQQCNCVITWISYDQLKSNVDYIHATLFIFGHIESHLTKKDHISMELEYTLQYSSRCIIMDDTLSNRTLKLLENIDPTAKFYVHYGYADQIDTTFIPSNFTTHINKQSPSFLSSIHEDNNARIIYVRLFLGEGKTNAIINLIPQYKYVVFLSARQEFARDLITKIEKFGVKSYLHLRQEHKISAIVAPKIIISCDSFPRLHFSTKIIEQTLFIVDEVELCLKHFTSTPFIKRDDLGLCINMFFHYIKECKKVVAMDAFLCERTLQLFDRLCPNETKDYIHNDISTRKSIIVVVPTQNRLVHEIIHALYANKKVVLCSNSLKFLNNMNGIINYTFKGEQQKSIKMVTSEHHQEHFGIDMEKDVLMYSPSVVAGNSYTAIHFDVLYAHFINNVTEVFECIQQLWRVRDIKEARYVHCRITSSLTLPITLDAVRSKNSRIIKTLGLSGWVAFSDVNGDLAFKVPDTDESLLYDVNEVQKNKSEMYFEQSMFGLLHHYGIFIVSISTISRVDDYTEVLHMLKVLEQQRILDAALLSDEECITVKNKLCVCDNEEQKKNLQAILTKNIIYTIYDLDRRTKLTGEFIETYTPQKIMNMYIFRKHLFTKSRVFAWDHIIEDYIEICKVTAKDNFAHNIFNIGIEDGGVGFRLKYAIALLQSCGFDGPFDTTVQVRNHIKNLMFDTYAYLYTQTVMNSYQQYFGWQHKKGPMNEFSQRIRHVNTVLKVVFNVSIREKKTSRNTSLQYTIKSDLFTATNGFKITLYM